MLSTPLRFWICAALVVTAGCKTAGAGMRTSQGTGLDGGADELDSRRASPEAVDAAVGAARSSAVGAIDAGRNRSPGWVELPADLEWSAILDPDREPKGSLSVGSVASGSLVNAAELDDSGPHHSIIERHRKHNTRWATRELVDIILHAAAHVDATAPGAPLRVGNMSRKRGGDIRWSNSHNSGRDADLAFYVVDAKTGESVPSPDLLSFDEAGPARGRPEFVFDVARNWKLTEGLLNHDVVDVQWLFISIPLKEALLEHARSTGADPELIARAESVLHQPTDSSPHNDHFHLRVTCPRNDRLEGCVDYGPKWEWADWHSEALLARALELARTFETSGVQERRAALEFLEDTKNPYGPDVAAVWGLWDSDEDVVDDAIDLIASQWSPSATVLVRIEKYLREGRASGRAVGRLYGVLRQSRDPLARDFALSRLIEPDVSPEEKVHAARSLGHFMEPEVAHALVAQLATQPPSVRAEMAGVLARITNRSDGVDWARADEPTVARAIAGWQSWLDANPSGRAGWLARGFTQAGVEMTEPDATHIDALLALLRSDQPHLVYNANRTIREVTGRWAPLEQDDGQALEKYWKKWWNKNRERVLQGGAFGDDS